MIKFCSYCYHYLRLIYSVNQYIKLFNDKGKHDILLLDTIITRIKNCGAVAIKFGQWLTPKLEIMYLEEEDILTEEKPLWLTKLEVFYENCDEHSVRYTISHYKEVFGEEFNEYYEIIDMIGSGSIGQVYLIEDKPLTKHTMKQQYVMKILHPKVKYEINFFRKFYKIIKQLPFVGRMLREYFPFDINNFIDQFNEQSDFINESNHLMKFSSSYKDNNSIIIPELLKTSSSIMIMSYEEGIPFEKIISDNYNKSKVALLLVAFTRNNQHILNYHHGDLHKGNWKVREEDNNYKLVIYDFGYCWSVPIHKISIIDRITELFENADKEGNTIDLSQMCDILSCFLKYDVIDEDNIKGLILEYLKMNMDNIKPWNINPSRLFKMTVQMCVNLNLLIDPMLIQSLILLIQCQKIFTEFRIISSDKDEIKSYEVYRSKYLDWIAFYKTNNIFVELSHFLTDILNEKQTEIDTIFDCVQMPDSIRNLALHK